MSARILQIHEKLQKKEMTATEITQAYINAAEKTSELNAYITTTFEDALSRAKSLDAAIDAGENINPLAGVPMTFKDNISTEGVLTTCGSRMLYNYNPIFNATVVDRLFGAGAISLGKTNLDEFAMGSTCETSYYKPTLNPYDLSKVPGGSSGGSAAAVAAGAAAYAIASDTGGSVRQPASYCGLYGLKPTYGAVSRHGLIAFASSFDQIGVIAASALDTAYVFDAISGYDPLDALSSQKKMPSVVETINSGVSGLRIGVISNINKIQNPAIEVAINNAMKTLESLGSNIDSVSIDQIEITPAVFFILSCAEAVSNLAKFDGVRYGYRTQTYKNWEDMMAKTRTEGFGDEVKRRLTFGSYVLSEAHYEEYFKKAVKMRGTIIRNFEKALNSFDLLVCPTSGTTALPLGATPDNPADKYTRGIYTFPANICGLPAMSVPIGEDGGMPIGLQLIGSKFSEALLLRTAMSLEESLGISIKPAIGGDPLDA